MIEKIVKEQALEIAKLRSALQVCLIASKEDSPLYYSSTLAIIQSNAHRALYGEYEEMDEVNRPVAMEAK